MAIINCNVRIGGSLMCSADSGIIPDFRQHAQAEMETLRSGNAIPLSVVCQDCPAAIE